MAEKYYGMTPYGYCAGNPVMMVDPDGEWFETALDITNVVLGMKSLVSNIKEGKTGDAVLDGVGLVYDVVAAVLPILPSVASTAIMAARAGDKAVNAAKAVDKVQDVNQASKSPSLSNVKEALIKAKEKIGLKPDESLPKQDGKFGSPSRGDQLKGYRLDPPHNNNGSESKPHINYWDYSNGKRNKGGISGSIEIQE